MLSCVCDMLNLWNWSWNNYALTINVTINNYALTINYYIHESSQIYDIILHRSSMNQWKGEWIDESSIK